MLVRAPIVRVADRGDETIVIGATGTARQFTGDSAALVRAVLEICSRPVTRAELLAELAARAGEPVPEAPASSGSAGARSDAERRAAVIDELVAMFEQDRILVDAAPLPAPPPQLRRVVLAISGAIAAVDAPALVRGLHGLGCAVRIALTKSAREFVAPAALEALV